MHWSLLLQGESSSVFSVQCTVTLMSMIAEIYRHLQIRLVNQTLGPGRAGSAVRLTARKRTNTTVQGQNTARVTRVWHVQGQEEE
jgi:uncharacterized UPF0146 family protein